jgi:hypothetical protein
MGLQAARIRGNWSSSIPSGRGADVAIESTQRNARRSIGARPIIGSSGGFGNALSRALLASGDRLVVRARLTPFNLLDGKDLEAPLHQEFALSRIP